MAHCVLFSFRDTPNSSEILKTKVAGQEVHRAIAKKMLKANVLITRFTPISGHVRSIFSVATGNCVNVIDTLQGFSSEASIW